MKKHLVAGLGNIGEEYENTRHNIGFNLIGMPLAGRPIFHLARVVTPFLHQS
ncbi:MAG: hypothetical protein U5L96_00025 [Owenweeksia sp.]|nr:hypothetical protein [Owenweeksia sp.]